MKRPNFVFFLVDDMGWGDPGCYGSEFHETPNIDRLCSEGMKFTSAYAACTVCSPSRAAILTGRYPGRTNLTDWIPGHVNKKAKLRVPDWQMHMDLDRTNMPKALTQAGYQTRFLGKWHLMPVEDESIVNDHFPTAHGFDTNVGGREWGQPKGGGKYFFPFDMPGLAGEDGDYLTDKLTDEADRILDNMDPDQPFLLYFSYYLVHTPIMTKPAYLEHYEKKFATGPWEPQDPNDAGYAGMMQSLDESVGRVVDAIERNGLTDNTIFFFVSDNGGDRNHRCGGFRGFKGHAYEGGTRVSQLIKWPGVVQPGSVCDEPTIGTDFYPTILEMAGLDPRPEEHVDGLSLVPLLKETGNLKRNDLFWHYPHYHRTKPYSAIRRKNMKLLEFHENGKLELYDLQKDRAEEHDLSGEMPELTRELYDALKAWRAEVGAQMPTPNPDYEPGG